MTLIRKSLLALIPALLLTGCATYIDVPMDAKSWLRSASIVLFGLMGFHFWAFNRAANKTPDGFFTKDHWDTEVASFKGMLRHAIYIVVYLTFAITTAITASLQPQPTEDKAVTAFQVMMEACRPPEGPLVDEATVREYKPRLKQCRAYLEALK